MACTGTLPLPLLAEGITHTPSESGDRSCQSRMLGWTSQAWEDPGVLDSAVSPIQNASAKSLTPFKGGRYGLPRGLSGKELTCSAGATGDAGSIPGSGRCPGGTIGLVFSSGEMPRREAGYCPEIVGKWSSELQFDGEPPRM